MIISDKNFEFIYEMESIILSFIIPVYNGSLYLKETIKSVLQQPCKDFELLLLDDGSKDNSLEICKQFESEQVKVFSHPNMGVSKTRNKGIELAKGDIIIFVDQDDAIRTDFYTTEMRNRLQEIFNNEIDLIVCGGWWGDSELQKGYFCTIENDKKGVYEGRKNEISWGNSYTFNVNIFSRRLFFDSDNKPTAVRFFELPLDVETIFRHITQYSARKILFSDDYSFCIRRNNDASVSSNWNWLRVYSVRCDAYFQLIEWHKVNYPDDSEALRGSELSFISKIEELIIQLQIVNTEYMEIRKQLSEKKYFPYILDLLGKYPKETQQITIFWNDPSYKVKSIVKKGIKAKLLDIFTTLFVKKKQMMLRKALLRI